MCTNNNPCPAEVGPSENGKKKCTRKVREHVLVRWGAPAWVCCDESSGSGNISHQHVTTDNFDDVDHHCAGHCAHCIMTQQCHGWGRGLFSSAAATVTLYYVIKTPLISNPQRQHPFDNISRCQVFCKNLKLATHLVSHVLIVFVANF